MGLDMYLKASKYFSGYDHGGDEAKEKFRSVLLAAGLDGCEQPGSPSVDVSVTVGYWRKANAIHKWFVDNVQHGEDECREHYASSEQLAELLSLCRQVEASKDASLLPPQGGFFFGSTEIDEGYWQDITDTIGILERVLNEPKLKDCDFAYRSSW